MPLPDVKPFEFVDKLIIRNTRILRLSASKDSVIVACIVLTQRQRVTDRRTDIPTIASRPTRLWIATSKLCWRNKDHAYNVTYRLVFTAVVVFCHSKRPVMGRFLFRAMERNMTNGDFAFFTYRPLRGRSTDKPWVFYVSDKNDIPRLIRAFHVVKQVCTYHSSVLYNNIQSVE